jgi:hypothetical protein
LRRRSGWLSDRTAIYRRAKTLPDGSQIYDVSYSIDTEGMRTTPAGKGSGAAPVFFFGDSFTFGEGVSNGQTLAAAFARVTEHGTVNFGVPGVWPSPHVADAGARPGTLADTMRFYGFARRMAAQGDR